MIGGTAALMFAMTIVVSPAGSTMFRADICPLTALSQPMTAVREPVNYKLLSS